MVKGCKGFRDLGCRLLGSGSTALRFWPYCMLKLFGLLALGFQVVASPENPKPKPYLEAQGFSNPILTELISPVRSRLIFGGDKYP